VRALSILQKPLHYRGVHLTRAKFVCVWVLAKLLLAPTFWFTRYFIVVPRPLLAAALVVRRRYLILVPRPMPASPRRYLIVVRRPLSAAPLVVRCRYLAVVPRPMPAAALVVHRRAVFMYRGAQAAAHGGARCASRVLDHGA
jgi:hypothetical protein